MAATPLAVGLARKVKKILDTRTEAPEVAGSLATLSEFYSADNTPAARRRLRSTIENEGVKINQQFLASAEGALDVVQRDLDSLSACCDTMTASLAASNSSTAELLQVIRQTDETACLVHLDTRKLQSALAASEVRSRLVARFLDQYQLAPAELAALQGEEVGEGFFEALAHVRGIHANCKALLCTSHQRAGLELMDAMASLQEGAYERLCRWVQAECRELSELDGPEVNPVLQRAAAALRDRPALLRYCAEEVAQARHTALFQRFIRALTRGPRPIEMHSHDPRRYVSDMLAWVHTSLASEREFLVALFGEEGDAPAAAGGGGGAARESEGAAALASPRGEAGGVEGAPGIKQLLDAVFESICRPLKVRIEQVLLSSPPPLLCFRLSQLLSFYLTIVEPMLGHASQLCDALRGCKAMALRAFQEQLRQRGDKLLRYPPPPPRGLEPPQQLLEGAQLLAELIASYDQSLDVGGGGAAAAASAADFSGMLSAVIAPLREMCIRSSEALNPLAASRVDDGSHLDPTHQSIFVINCLLALAAPLAGRPCALAQAQQLHDALEGQLAALVEAEVGRVLARCRLADVSQRIKLHQQRPDEGQPLAQDPVLALERVADAMRTFFGKLSDPTTLPDFPQLQVPRIKGEAVQRVSQALADAYAAVHAALLDPASGYDGAAVGAAVRQTPAQVRMLLGVV
eukprot:scaffold1.g5804.t1